ncbi:MAG: D-alanyl-D-alanine carboxypeptidase [Peptococcaceae bacterium]|nr:D-alanyl-D-alanine carboxypeptidase [Peptococcaceae bacterium]
MRGYAVRLTLMGIFVLHSMVCFTAPAFAQAVPEITAEAAVMLDMDTGEVLYGKAEHERRPPASLTKVMTGYLAAQRQDLMHQEVVISELAAETGESSLNLKEKDVLCFEELLYGALLKSANDACVAVAEHISGSEEIFVDDMNLQACLLGCANTKFQNTNGLPAEEHYSSAYDLALMTRAAMQVTQFAQIVQTQNHTVHWQDGRKLLVHNTNRLLREYPGAIGVKTGTTNEAGQCLIAVAEKAGKRVAVVVLKSRNRFYDATVLLDYAFAEAAAEEASDRLMAESGDLQG